MNRESTMNQNEIVKGIAGSASGMIAMGIAWIEELSAFVRLASFFAGFILTCVMIRYWWIRGNRIKQLKEDDE
jgi:hypothetical protein